MYSASYFIVSLICIYTSSVNGFQSSSSVYRHMSKLFVSVMPPADLTPAVDKYPCLPVVLMDNIHVENAIPPVTARGPVPTGPEPFGLVAGEVQPLADYVKELVKSENPVLTMAASHFFEQVCYPYTLIHSLLRYN